MLAGETVLVEVNGGQWTECQIIEIHGDIVRVAGVYELASAKLSAREPLGVGFSVHKIKVIEKAKSIDNA